MDLASLDTAEAANQGAVLELRGPDGSPILQDDKSPVTITLLGDDSDILTKVNNRHANQYLRGGPGGSTITAEMTRANEINKFAAATVGWSGIEVDGEVLKHTDENAKALYRRFGWIRDQVRVFIADRANFTKPSRTI